MATNNLKFPSSMGTPIAALVISFSSLFLVAVASTIFQSSLRYDTPIDLHLKSVIPITALALAVNIAGWIACWRIKEAKSPQESYGKAFWAAVIILLFTALRIVLQIGVIGEFLKFDGRIIPK